MFKIILKLLIVLVLIYLVLIISNIIETKIVEAPLVEAVELEPWQTKTDPLFEKIGFCESNHELKARNPKSTAKGEFQFLDGSWKYYGKLYWGDDWVNKDVLSEDNRELAWFVYKKNGTKDWNASEDCWNGVK